MAERQPAQNGDEAAANRLLVFRAGGVRYALPHEAVQEIVRPLALARVPLSPKALLGIGNLRGSVLPVADLSVLLGGEAASTADSGKVLVLSGASPVGLHVDQVDELADARTGSIQAADAALSAREGAAITGLFRAENTAPVRILELGQLLSRAFVPTGMKASGIAPAYRRSERSEGDVLAQDILVTFEVAGQEFALPVDCVLEVMPADEGVATRAHDGAALGLLSFRGVLLPLFSLRTLLGFEESAESAGRTLIARVGGSQVGLTVDRVREIIRVPKDANEAVPGVIAERATGEARPQSIVKLDHGRRLVSVLSPDHLFREDIMNRMRREASSSTTGPAQAAATPERVFLVFRLGGQEYAVAIGAVEEVSRLPEQITPLPQAPDFLKGVMNLRGAVLPVIDQRARFGMPAEDGEGRRLIVMRIGARIAGFIVDSVSEVLRTPESNIMPAPPILAGDQPVDGVINVENLNRIILLLDPDRLLSSTERGLLDALGRVEEAQQTVDQAPDRR